MREKYPQGIFLDFDGVLVESSSLKVDAFVQACIRQDPTLESDLRLGLTTNLVGCPRFKIAHWLQQKSQIHFDVELFLADFAYILKTQIAHLHLRAGTDHFFHQARLAEKRLAIVSSAPKGDIVNILRQNQFDRSCLDGIYGSEDGEKETILKQLMACWELHPTECVMVGDMPSDARAAASNQLPFVRFDSDLSEHCQWQGLSSIARVTTFADLGQALYSGL